MKTKTWKRILSFVLVFTMVFSMVQVPNGADAAEDPVQTSAVEEAAEEPAETSDSTDTAEMTPEETPDESTEESTDAAETTPEETPDESTDTAETTPEETPDESTEENTDAAETTPAETPETEASAEEEAALEIISAVPVGASIPLMTSTETFTITASTTLGMYSGSAANVIDGDLATKMYSSEAPAVNEDTVTLAFSEWVTLSSMTLVQTSGNDKVTTGRFEYLGTDGTWKELSTFTADDFTTNETDTSLIEHTADYSEQAITACAVRVYNTASTSYWWQLHEWTVNGTVAADVEAEVIQILPEVTTTVRPEDGTTYGQPFASGTGGSTNFRIPGIVTLNDGTLVAACDARWNHAGDALALDTIVSRSTDGGKTWNYTFANYLGDNGNVKNNNSTAFIDPAVATDGETVYLIADLYPAGIGINTAPYAPKTGSTGFTEDGKLQLAKATSQVNGISSSTDRAAAAYDYYLEPIAGATDRAEAYYKLMYKPDDATEATVVEDGYRIDAHFNIKGNGVDTNLFCGDSPYFPWPTDYLYMTKSEDGGATWSNPQLLDLKAEDELTILVGPGRGIVTDDGNVVFTAYIHNSSSDEHTVLLYSADKGKTWQRGENKISDATSEAAVVEANGKLFVFTRHNNKYYVSSDHGTTWTAYASGISYNTGCEITAITYSKQINGQTAILLAAPCTSGRSNGKIFAGLVQDDDTIEWIAEYEVTGSGVYYAYSCLTELKDGNIGLLWENASASITYTEIDFDDIVREEIELAIGEEYIVKGSGEITAATEPDTDIVKYEVTPDKSEYLHTVHDHVSDNSSHSSLSDAYLAAESTVSIDDAQFTFTLNDEGYYNIMAPYNSHVLTIAGASDYFGDSTVTQNLSVRTVTTGDETNFVISREDSSTHRAMVFYDAKLKFDRSTITVAEDGTPSISGTNVHMLMTLFEKDETVTEGPIPGYKKVDSITSGKQYLIAYVIDDSNAVLLYPEDGSNGQNAKLIKLETGTYTELKFTGVSDGTTTAVIGGVTYEITVKAEGVNTIKNVVLVPDEVYVDSITSDTALTATVTPTDTVATLALAFKENVPVTALHSRTANSSASAVNGSFQEAADASNSLSDALFTFTEVSSGWNIYSDTNGTYIDLSAADNYYGSATTLTIETVTEEETVDETTVTETYFRIKNSSNRYAVFYATNMVFDAWSTSDVSSVTNTAVRFNLTLLEPKDTVEDTDIFPGYQKATQIVSGNKYLIAYEYEETVDETVTTYTFVLYPVNGQANQTKLPGETTYIDNNEVTITGVANGTTKAIVDDIQYNITVNATGESEDEETDTREIDPSMMTVTTGSQQSTSGTEGPASNVLDGNTGTIWHTNYSNSEHTSSRDLHWIVFELAEVYEVDGLTYLPRQTGTNGYILEAEIYVSMDGVNWGTAVATPTWASNASLKEVSFEPVSARYVKLVSINSVGMYATAAEIRLTGEGRKIASDSITAAAVNDNFWGSNTAALAVDGSKDTFWTTTTATFGADAAGLILTLDAEYEIDSFSYLPRQDGHNNGQISAFDLYVSDDGSTWTSLTITKVSAETYDASSYQDVTFEPVTTKYVKFVPTASNVSGNTHSSAAEVQLYGEKVTILNTEMTASANCNYTGNSTTDGPASWAIDGNTSTKWHSDWSDDADHTHAEDNGYHWLQLDLTERHLVTELSYIPSTNGIITDYRIEAKKADGAWVTVKEGTWDVAAGETATATFDYPAEADSIRLTALAVTGAEADQSRFCSALEVGLKGKKVSCDAHELVLCPAVAQSCVKAGNVAYWECTECGMKFKEENAVLVYAGDSWMIPANGEGNHNYVYDGETRCGCGYVEGLGQFESNKVVIGDTIVMEFGWKFDDGVEAPADAQMVFTNVDKKEKIISVAVSSVTPDSDGLYGFQCPVPAKEMNDVIRATLKNADGEALASYDYSIKEYADYIIAHAADNTAYAEVVPVVKAMLNYGGYSQIYFNYNKDDLANAEVADEFTDAMEAIEASQFTAKAVADSNNLATNAKYMGSSIFLESETKIRHYFDVLTEGKPLEAFDITCTLDGEEVAVETGVTNAGDFYVEIQGICANRFADVYTVVVTDTANSESFSIDYSVNAYFYSVLTAAKNVKLMNTVKAMSLYGTAVKDALGE